MPRLLPKPGPRPPAPERRPRRRRAAIEGLEGRALLAPYTAAQLSAYFASLQNDPQTANATDPDESPAIVEAEAANQLTPTEVNQLLDRASAAVPDQTGIIAVVDRDGRILGVRVEDGVSPPITGNTRTWSSPSTAPSPRRGPARSSPTTRRPLTSRTIQNISQSTITQREVESNPSITDPNSTSRARASWPRSASRATSRRASSYTPQVDLFQIEQTNRDSIDQLDRPDGILPSTLRRYSRSVAVQRRPRTSSTRTRPDAQSHGARVVRLRLRPGADRSSLGGIGTLPGGIPIFKVVDVNGKPDIVVGGIGVFFPGRPATPPRRTRRSTTRLYDPKKPDRRSRPSIVAFAAAAAQPRAGAHRLPDDHRRAGRLPPVPGLDLLPASRTASTSAGSTWSAITLDVFGPDGIQGRASSSTYGHTLGLGKGTATARTCRCPPIAGDPVSVALKTRSGQIVPSGWLVLPHDGDGDHRGRRRPRSSTTASPGRPTTRAAIRLPLEPARARWSSP